MATLQFPKKGKGGLAAAPITATRVIDVVVDLATDVVMGTATDDITLVDLPAGTVVITAGIEQVTAGTEGTGTLTARVGTTAVSAALAHNAVAGTLAASGTAAPQVVPAAGATLNVIGATAVRLTGKVRVFAVVVEGTWKGAVPVIAARDTSI